MKLRCVRNSIRLRLSKSDTRNLQTNGEIWESLEIGPGSPFYFGLCLEADIEKIVASFSEAKLKVTLPRHIGEAWINSQEVGIQNTPTPEQDSTLSILIEKDFPCKLVQTKISQTALGNWLERMKNLLTKSDNTLLSSLIPVEYCPQ